MNLKRKMKMNIKKIVLRCVTFLWLVLFLYACTQEKAVNEKNNQVKATINDSLDIVIFFNENSNVGTIVLKNKVSGVNNIYGYNDDGITPVLAGRELKGQRDGLYLTFYSNGFLNTRSIYSEGELNGYIESFSEDGKIIYKALYEKGIEKRIEIKDSITFEPEIKEMKQ